MNNINKDKLVEMIRSSDSEIKDLGMSLLLDNFDLPEKLYYIKDSDGYYTYSWEFSTTSINPINKEIIELPHIPKHKFDIYVFHFNDVMHTSFQPKIQYVYITADTIVIKSVIYIVFLFAFITTPP